MTDFKIRGKCEGCRKTKWFIAKRRVTLPNGMEAKSQFLMCRRCINNVRKSLK